MKPESYRKLFPTGYVVGKPDTGLMMIFREIGRNLDFTRYQGKCMRCGDVRWYKHKGLVVRLKNKIEGCKSCCDRRNKRVKKPQQKVETERGIPQDVCPWEATKTAVSTTWYYNSGYYN